MTVQTDTLLKQSEGHSIEDHVIQIMKVAIQVMNVAIQVMNVAI